jgi:hypothetical protein
MEEQWNVIYVDISNREMTSRTLDSRESARLHASDLNRDHHEVLRLTGPDGVRIERACIFDWIGKNAVWGKVRAYPWTRPTRLALGRDGEEWEGIRCLFDLAHSLFAPLPERASLGPFLPGVSVPRPEAS